MHRTPVCEMGISPITSPYSTEIPDPLQPAFQLTDHFQSEWEAAVALDRLKLPGFDCGQEGHTKTNPTVASVSGKRPAISPFKSDKSLKNSETVKATQDLSRSTKPPSPTVDRITEILMEVELPESPTVDGLVQKRLRRSIAHLSPFRGRVNGFSSNLPSPLKLFKTSPSTPKPSRLGGRIIEVPHCGTSIAPKLDSPESQTEAPPSLLLKKLENASILASTMQVAVGGDVPLDVEMLLLWRNAITKEIYALGSQCQKQTTEMTIYQAAFLVSNKLPEAVKKNPCLLKPYFCALQDGNAKDNRKTAQTSNWTNQFAPWFGTRVADVASRVWGAKSPSRTCQKPSDCDGEVQNSADCHEQVQKITNCPRIQDKWELATLSTQEDTSCEVGSSSVQSSSAMSTQEDTSCEVGSSSVQSSSAMEESTCNESVAEEQEEGIVAFHNDADFKAHFNGRIKEMREMLCMYTTSPNTLKDGHGPLFHQKKRGVVDEDIPGFFNAVFEFQHFIKRGENIVPGGDSVFRLTDVIRPLLAKQTALYKEVKELRDGYRYRYNAASDLERRLATQRSLSTQQKAMRYAWKQVQVRMRDFTADGGFTNGEFTLHSLITIFNEMEALGVNSKTCIVDCGSGYGGINWAFLAYFGCPTYGVEVELERSRIAAELYQNIVSDPSSPLARLRIGHFNADLNFIDDYPAPTEVAWCFDSVWQTSLKRHVYNALARNKNLWMIISSGRLAEELSGLGFWCAKAVPCKMTISSETHTMCIWIRDVPERSSAEKDEHIGQLVQGNDMDRAIHAMLYSSDESRSKAYRILYKDVVSVQDENKRRRKYIMKKDSKFASADLVCRRGSYHACLGHCSLCDSFFKILQDRVRERASPIHGKGLFALFNLAANSFVVPVSGTRTKQLPEDPSLQNRTMQLASDKTGTSFLVMDEKNGDLCHTVNHSCQNPNCLLIGWWNSKNEECFALVTNKPVKKKEELTVNYGFHFEDAWKGRCNCPTCNNRQNKNVLFACMKYCDLGNRDVAKLVASGDWKDMDGRDTNRIVEMERQDSSLCVFTTNNNETGGTARMDRHVYGDFKDDKWVGYFSDFLNATGRNPSGFFSEAIWDDMWNPPAYNQSRWGSKLYSKHIRNFAPMLKAGGSIIFPCHGDVLSQLASHEQEWLETYKVEFILEHEQACNPLWSATTELDELDLFGKSNDNSAYCKLTRTTIRNMRDNDPDADVVQKLAEMDDSKLEKIRYVRLKKRDSSMSSWESPS